MKRKNILLLVLIIMALAIQTISTAVCATIPQKMSFQAIIRDASNKLITNQTVGMRISILQGASDGTAVYVETFTPTTNTSGIVTLKIGTGTPVTNTFSSINWSSGVYYIKTETDLTGGTAYSITSTSELISVPHAFYSGNGMPKGDYTGDMKYWNGSAWTSVSTGLPGQLLTLSASGIPSWSGKVPPVISTGAVVAQCTTASSGGTISTNGGSAVTARGVCWSTTSGPTINDSKTSDGTGIGDFTSSLTGLTGGLTYYLRAYATNNYGTAYGTENSFTTATSAYLSSLAVRSGTTAFALTPSFSKTTMSYTASVSYDVSTITVTPQAEAANATITVNGTAVASGYASGPISLSLGSNTPIYVTVTSQTGETNTYIISITRNHSTYLTSLIVSPVGKGVGPSVTVTPNATDLTYFATVATNTVNMTITPTVEDSGATIKVNTYTVASGSASPSIAFSTNPIAIQILVEAGNSSRTYTLNVSK
jgi:hypothetical protein